MGRGELAWLTRVARAIGALGHLVGGSDGEGATRTSAIVVGHDNIDAWIWTIFIRVMSHREDQGRQKRGRPECTSSPHTRVISLRAHGCLPNFIWKVA